MKKFLLKLTYTCRIQTFCAFLYKAATRANYVPQQRHKKLGKNLVSQLEIRILEIAIRLTGQTLHIIKALKSLDCVLFFLKWEKQPRVNPQQIYLKLKR